MTTSARSSNSELGAIRIDLEGIGAALKNRRLVVPVYQRSFMWQEQNVRDLFQDVTTALDNSDPEYFLGSVVAAGRAEGRQEIVDGQQRLATTTILLAAIRDYFLQSGDQATADDIEREFLVQTDLRTRELTARLKLNDFDNDFFLKRVLSRPGAPERSVEMTKDSHRYIAKAAELAAGHIAALAQASGRARDRILDLFDFVQGRAKVIWVSVPDHANAFVIFETLNDRGLDLAISDLLKNYLFLLADDRLSEVQQNWTTMLGVLETISDEGVSVDFIRHLWSSYYGATRERELYASIKRSITAKQPAIDFSLQLAQGARLYAAVLNPDHAIWAEYGPSARGYVSTINFLRMVQLRPLLLAVLDRFSTSEVVKALRMMVSWGVRFQVVGGGGAGVLESHYSNRAREVRSGAIRTAADLGRQMANVVPNDAVFEAAFATTSVSKAALARYYLQVLERQARGEAEPELVPNTNQEQVNLEHVLPQNPSQDWGTIPGEIARAHYNRLGNLCLLRAGANSSIGNDGFASKRDTYRDSQLLLTKMLGDAQDWTVAEISGRQQRLARLATEAWALRA